MALRRPHEEPRRGGKKRFSILRCDTMCDNDRYGFPPVSSTGQALRGNDDVRAHGSFLGNRGPVSREHHVRGQWRTSHSCEKMGAAKSHEYLREVPG